MQDATITHPKITDHVPITHYGVLTLTTDGDLLWNEGTHTSLGDAAFDLDCAIQERDWVVTGWVKNVFSGEDVTAECITFLRRYYNAERKEWPEWIGGPSAEEIAADIAATVEHVRQERHGWEQV